MGKQLKANNHSLQSGCHFCEAAMAAALMSFSSAPLHLHKDKPGII